MDALRKQASKFKTQVAKQQQAVIKQFSSSGYESSDVIITDEVEFGRHQQLDKLYKSTRSVKDFQKEIIRAIEALNTIITRQMEIGTKLSQDCCIYGGENVTIGNLARAASTLGDALTQVGKEQEELIKVFTEEVLEPLKAMVTSAPLEIARHLGQRYSRMRHEAELQNAELSRRQSRNKEAPTLENSSKLQTAESKMREIKESLTILGKEAATSLSSVEAQQHTLTFQRLVSLVNAQKSYHQRLAVIFDEVEAEMLSGKQQKDSAPPLTPLSSSHDKKLYFMAEAVYPFYAKSEKELSLNVGDFIVIRKVSESGWSEGECRGKAGWFPSAYVEKRQRIPTNKVAGYAF